MEKSNGWLVPLLVVGFGVWYYAGDAINGFLKPIDKPDVSIEVSQLLSDVARNPVAVEQRYAGQTLAVTGPLHRIESTSFGPVVSVGRLMKNIDCQLSKSDSAQVARLQAGQLVTVQGRLKLDGLFPAMKPCIVN